MPLLAWDDSYFFSRDCLAGQTNASSSTGLIFYRDYPFHRQKPEGGSAIWTCRITRPI
jgi:hypothetical protein